MILYQVRRWDAAPQGGNPRTDHHTRHCLETLHGQSSIDCHRGKATAGHSYPVEINRITLHSYWCHFFRSFRMGSGKVSGYSKPDTDNCSCVSLLFLSVIPFYALHPNALCLLSVLAVSSDLGTISRYHTQNNTVDLLFRLYTPRTRFFTVSVIAM